VYFEYICWKFAGRLLDRVNTLLTDCYLAPRLQVSRCQSPLQRTGPTVDQRSSSQRRAHDNQSSPCRTKQGSPITGAGIIGARCTEHCLIGDTARLVSSRSVSHSPTSLVGPTVAYRTTLFATMRLFMNRPRCKWARVYETAN